MMDESREIVHLHVGQAGIQMGAALWRQYIFEHQVSLNGRTIWGQDERKKAVFTELGGRVYPRAILVDTDPMTIEDISYSRYSKLFHEEHLIKGKEDGASCYPRTAYDFSDSEPNTILLRTKNAIRMAAEACNRLEGFQLMRSISGGTGSGLGSAILQLIKDEYPKNVKLELSLFPSPNMSSIVVESYNAILATHASMDKSDCTIVFDNESCYHRNRSSLAMEHSSYDQINRTLALCLAGLTAPFRFKSYHNTCFSDLQTNLVAFPELHFPLISYCPVASKAHPCNLDTVQITGRCFEQSSQLLRCEPQRGLYMACALFYRGKVTTEEVSIAKARAQQRDDVNFASWAAGAFKEEITPKLPPQYTGEMYDETIAESSRALCMIANNTVIAEQWENMLHKFEELHQSKQYVHHFLREGLGENTFDEAKSQIQRLIEGYKAQGSVPIKEKPEQQNSQDKISFPMDS